MAGMVADLDARRRQMKKAAGEGYATATDLADWLVRALKLPFREAHHVTGRIVAKAAEAGVPLHRLPLAAMQEIEPRISDGRVQRALGRQIGEKPGELRRHRAQERAGAGEAVVEAAGAEAVARMERSEIRERSRSAPGFAARHPGYLLAQAARPQKLINPRCPCPRAAIC